MTLVIGHPDRAPREPVFQADLTNKLRAWLADIWNKVGRPAGARPRGGGRLAVRRPAGPAAGWADRRGALALERPPMTAAAGGACADGRWPATACPRPAQGCDLSLSPPCTGLWQVSAADAGRPDSPSTLTAVSQAQRTLPSCPVRRTPGFRSAVGAASAGASNRRFADTATRACSTRRQDGRTCNLAPPTGQPESHHLSSSLSKQIPLWEGRSMRSVMTRCGLDPNCTVRDKGGVTGGWLRRRRCLTHPTPLGASPPRTWPPRRPRLSLPAPRPVGVDGLIV